MLNIIAGLDPNDNTTIDNKNEDYLSGIDSGIEGKKIGIIKDMMGLMVLILQYYLQQKMLYQN